jgi:hypothetical protein
VGDEIGFLMVGFMPESRPDYWLFLFRATNQAQQRPIVAAGKAFLDDLMSVDYTIPYWQSYGFWWAAVSVIVPLSVHALEQALDRWYSRVCSALTYWEWHSVRCGDTNLPEPAEDQDEARWYWGVWADLRHAGLLTLAREGSLPEALQAAARECVEQENSFSYPSEMQNPIPPELAKTWTTSAT